MMLFCQSQIHLSHKYDNLALQQLRNTLWCHLITVAHILFEYNGRRPQSNQNLSALS